MTPTAERVACWLSAGNCEAVAGYLAGRYDCIVSSDVIQDWRNAYMHNKKEFPHLNDPDMWLKKRMEFEAGERPDDVYLSVTLHVFNLFWPDVPLPEDKTAKRYAPTLARQYDVQARSIGPVNRTARLVSLEDSFGCRYCGAWFRNAAAMLLHAKERHGAEYDIIA